MVNYLSTALESGLLSSRNAIIHLLFTCESSSIPLPTLTAICSILNTSPIAIEPIPSSLELPQGPIPHDGPSSPPPQRQTWTLSLLLPLLRLCSDPQNQAITQLVSRVLAAVAPYPAPPFDVGLQASQLMGSMPELVAVPLKESLSGLMMDLAMSDAAPPVTSQAQPQQQQQQSATSGATDDDTFKLMTPVEAFGGNLPLHIALLVRNYLQQRARTSITHTGTLADAGATPTPNNGLIDLLKACCSVYDLGESILTRLLAAALGQVASETPEFNTEHIAACMFILEDMPVLLRWWKDHSDDVMIPYPVCPTWAHAIISDGRRADR